MAAEVATLIAKLEMDSRDFDRNIKQATKRIDELEGSTADTGKSVGGLTKKFRGASLAMGAFAGGVVATKTIQFLSSAVGHASDLGESINAVEKVFGGSAESIIAFGRTSAESVGLANAAFNELATNTGALLQNFGFAADSAASQTINLTKRAADLASVFNTDVSDAMGAINSALRGETEPIRRFAIDVSNATLESYALSQGIDKSVESMSMQEKVALRIGAIMEQSSKAAGDFADTSDSLANASRRLSAEWENAQAAIGEALIPIVEQAIPALIRGVQLVSDAMLGLRRDAIQVRSAIDFLPGISDTPNAVETIAVIDETIAINRAMRDGEDRADALEGSMRKLFDRFGASSLVLGQFQTNTHATDEEMYHLYRTLLDTGAAGPEAAGALIAAFAPYISVMRDTGDETSTAGDRVRGMIADVEGLPGPLDDAADSANGLADAVNGINGEIDAIDTGKIITAVREFLALRDLLGKGIGPKAGSVDVGGIIGFQSGGMVPGPLGAPRLAMVHGGEQVLTPTQQAERNLNIYMQGNYTGGGAMQDEMTLGLLMAGVNEQAQFHGLSDIRG